MIAPQKILVFHTAFPGDIILTVPVFDVLRDAFPRATIGAVVIPSASGVLLHHPAIHQLIIYDKRGADSGFRGAFALVRRLKAEGFDTAVVPHRSLRSALILRAAGIPRRIGFSTSAGRLLMTDIVPYDPACHEIRRNLNLLKPLGIVPATDPLPRIYPDGEDCAVVDSLLAAIGDRTLPRAPLVALAPGSKWNTKRWLPEYYGTLGKMLVARQLKVVLVGGPEDRELCTSIASAIGGKDVIVAAGRLTLLQSAELIRRSAVLVSNDSAPVHLGVAVRTPVLAIFGPTVPRFGFAPKGEHDEVIERSGLDCRPCSIHGGKRCPLGTFVCMKEITPAEVLARVMAKLGIMHAEK